jgi:hypothetical protein
MDPAGTLRGLRGFVGWNDSPGAGAAQGTAQCAHSAGSGQVSSAEAHGSHGCYATADLRTS